MTIDAMTSAIKNHVSDGLKGVNVSYSLDQLKDEILLERSKLIKQYSLNGTLNKRSLLQSITCIELDCKDLASCCKVDTSILPSYLHFKIPQLSSSILVPEETIEYLGDVGRTNPFEVYLTDDFLYHQYRRRPRTPYAWINPVPSDGYHDGFLFKADYLKYITIVGVFENPLSLSEWDCCGKEYDDFSFFAAEIINNISQRYIYYYRQLNMPNQPNTQTSILS